MSIVVPPPPAARLFVQRIILAGNKTPQMVALLPICVENHLGTAGFLLPGRCVMRRVAVWLGTGTHTRKQRTRQLLESR